MAQRGAPDDVDPSQLRVCECCKHGLWDRLIPLLLILIPFGAAIYFWTKKNQLEKRLSELEECEEYAGGGLVRRTSRSTTQQSAVGSRKGAGGAHTSPKRPGTDNRTQYGDGSKGGDGKGSAARYERLEKIISHLSQNVVSTNTKMDEVVDSISCLDRKIKAIVAENQYYKPKQQQMRYEGYM